jgi:RNA polymerase sigma factor (sigma-70 family)
MGTLMDDQRLLERFTRDGSQDAFRELTVRYTNLVYGCAVQRLRDAHAAQDVTQAVFLALALKAQKLRTGAPLPGWLFKATRFACAMHQRGEQRRKEREMRVFEESQIADSGTPTAVAWEEMQPHLSGALDSLSSADREAVLLRFYRQASHQEVATALGTSEDGARMRVDRALDKLRRFITNKGVALSATALAGALTAHAAPAAPAGLAATAGATALAGAGGTLTATSTLVLAKGAIQMMFWNSVKTAALVTAAAITVGGAGVTTVVAVAKEQAKTEAKANPGAEAAWPALGSALRIRMTDSDGTAVSNASVEVAFDLPYPSWRRPAIWTFAWTNTDANGSCKLSVPSNAIAAYLAFVEPSATSDLCVTHVTGAVEPVFAYGRTRLRLKPSSNGVADIRVQTASLPCRIAGRVTGPDKKPVASVTIVFSKTLGLPARKSSPPYFDYSWANNRSYVIVTGPDGAYDILLPEGEFRVQYVSCPTQPLLYWDERGRGATASKRLRRGMTKEHDIELSQGCAIEATMLDTENKPVKGVTPRLTARFLPLGAGVSSGASRLLSVDAASNEDGQTVLCNIPPGLVSLSITPPKESQWVPLTPSIVTAVESGLVAKLTLRLVRGATLRGKITTDDGAPVAGYRLRENAISDANGNYVIEGLPSGTVSLTSDQKNYPGMGFATTSQVEVCAGGDFSCDLVLKKLKKIAPVELTGRILDQQGNAVPRVTVLARPMMPIVPNQMANSLSGISGDDGRYRIAGLTAGRVDVSLEIPSDLPLDRPVEKSPRMFGTDTITLTASSENVRDFPLVPATVVRLNLRDEKGNPVTAPQLHCSDTVTNANSSEACGVQFKPGGTPGTFVVRLGTHEQKPGGVRFLALKPDPGALLPDPVAIPLGTDVGNAIERTVVLRCGATIQGQLLDAGGKPVEDASITYWKAEEYDRMKQFGDNFLRAGLQTDIVTDPNGRFRIENLPPGDYVVKADNFSEEAPQFHEPARIALDSARDFDLQLVCEPIGTVEVQVCTSDDEKVASGARLVSTTASAVESAQSSVWPPSSEDPFRPCRITVRPGKYELVTQPFACIESGGIQTLRELDAIAKQLPKTVLDVVAGKTTNVTVRLPLTAKEYRSLRPTRDNGSYSHNTAVDREKISQRLLADWSKVRLAEQSIYARVNGSRLVYTNTLRFVAAETVTNALLGFVLRPETEQLAVSVGGKPLAEIEHAPPYTNKPPETVSWPDRPGITPRRADSKDDRKDSLLRDRDNAIGGCLSAFAGDLWNNTWRAWYLDLAPEQTNTAMVNGTVKPFPFANSAKGDPCIAYRIPIRQGCCWARPAGKLAVTLTLGDDVKPEDVVFVRPTEVKRDGRTLTYTLDGADPDEDLLLVLKLKAERR